MLKSRDNHTKQTLRQQLGKSLPIATAMQPLVHYSDSDGSEGEGSEEREGEESYGKKRNEGRGRVAVQAAKRARRDEASSEVPMSQPLPLPETIVNMFGGGTCKSFSGHTIGDVPPVFGCWLHEHIQHLAFPPS